MTLFVSNLHFDLVDERVLRDLFEPYGSLERVHLARDRETDRSRGFAFVTMSKRADGERAVEELSNTKLNGRTLFVREAVDKEKKNV